MRRALATGFIIGCFVGCNSSEPVPQPTGPVAETASAKDSPIAYRVLADEVNKQANTVDYHLLIAAGTKHDDVEGLLKYLYRHLMTRTETQPTGLAAYVYTDESQYK